MKDPWSSKWRLFSGGLDGSLIEWDLHQRKVAIGTDALGGAVWAIAVQPQSLKQCADSRELDQETERDASEGGHPNAFQRTILPLYLAKAPNVSLLPEMAQGELVF